MAYINGKETIMQFINGESKYFIGSKVTAESEPETHKLHAPIISLNGDILTIEINNPCTVYCDILVNGEVEATVEIPHTGGGND